MVIFFNLCVTWFISWHGHCTWGLVTKQIINQNHKSIYWYAIYLYALNSFTLDNGGISSSMTSTPFTCSASNLCGSWKMTVKMKQSSQILLITESGNRLKLLQIKKNNRAIKTSTILRTTLLPNSTSINENHLIQNFNVFSTITVYFTFVMFMRSKSFSVQSYGDGLH